MAFGFGPRLAELRKAKGLTQEALGKGLGEEGKDASKSVVYGWEKEQHYPKVDQLRLIIDKLACTADYLITGRQAVAELSPEVATVASRIDALPKKQRDWMLRQIQLAFEGWEEAVAARNGEAANGVMVDTPASSKRTKTG